MREAFSLKAIVLIPLQVKMTCLLGRQIPHPERTDRKLGKLSPVGVEPRSEDGVQEERPSDLQRHRTAVHASACNSRAMSATVPRSTP